MSPLLLLPVDKVLNFVTLNRVAVVTEYGRDQKESDKQYEKKAFFCEIYSWEFILVGVLASVALISSSFYL